MGDCTSTCLIIRTKRKIYISFERFPSLSPLKVFWSHVVYFVVKYIKLPLDELRVNLKNRISFDVDPLCHCVVSLVSNGLF